MCFMATLDDKVCYVAVYVDDLLIIAPTVDLVCQIKSALNQRFSMTDLGEVKYILCWSIERNREARTIFIHQREYACTVLDRFKQLVATPSDRNTKLTTQMQPKTQLEKEIMQDIPYREVVGSVMYLMVGTRPDLAFYMRDVSQFLANPGQEHWKAVTRGLKYLSGTADHGL
ncbi:Copia LTR rider [Phytophthora megakarya]|uniref:Copia LTR rider n=1 Tax=Phytophthora megakarya TaxID=4795 RepID=A0A225ULE4_9STRA|nr:Copia LTR rider [Phytophthora megakarya]